MGNLGANDPPVPEITIFFFMQWPIVLQLLFDPLVYVFIV